MSRTPFILSSLLLLGACRDGKLIYLGTELPDGGHVIVIDAGQDAGAPDSGLPDAGPPDSGPGDAGAFDAGPPLDYSRALKSCSLVDACLNGADFGTGIRGEWFADCLAILASPVPTAAQLADWKSGGWTLSGWFLPTPIWLGHPQVRSCLDQASTCGRVVECFNFGTPPPPCSQLNGTVTCSGSVMTVCTAPSENLGAAASTLNSFSYDCATTGGTCVLPTNPAILSPQGCAAGSCGADFQRCDSASQYSMCSNGRLDIVKCASDMHCEVSGGYAGCVSDLPACDVATYRSTCPQPSQVTACANGALQTTHCDPGTTCQVAPNGTGFCGVASECAPFDEIPLCADGSTLKVCAFGKWTNVPCSSMGFSTCMPPDLLLRDGAVCQ